MSEKPEHSFVTKLDVSSEKITLVIAKGNPDDWELMGEDYAVPVLASVELTLTQWYSWLENHIEYLKNSTHGTQHYPHNI